MNELTTEQRQVSVYSDVNLYNQCFKMAESMAKSELVPNNYRNKPESCLIAIDVARQIGARSPLFVMQNLFVVNGKPSWSGQYCDAIVRANFQKVKVDLSGTGNDRGCKITAYDENGNFCEGTRVTMEMAHKEGWFSKTGSKWQTMPDLMLQYRAFAFFARIHCPEKLLGIHDEFENVDISKLETKAENPFEDVIDVEVEQPTEIAQELTCSKCGAKISQKVADYSLEKYGSYLCMKCQKEAGNVD